MNLKSRFLFSILFGLSFFFSCNNKGSQETIDISELLPTASNDYDFSNEKIDSIISPSETQELLLLHFPTINFIEKNELYEEKRVFLPNRLGYSDKEELYFFMDTIPFHFIIWEFEEPQKTKSAFYNWLDCFNKECNSIRITEEKNLLSNAFLLGESDKSILFLESNVKIMVEPWKELLFNHDSIPLNFLLSQAPKGKVKWLQIPSEK